MEKIYLVMKFISEINEDGRYVDYLDFNLDELKIKNEGGLQIILKMLSDSKYIDGQCKIIKLNCYTKRIHLTLKGLEYFSSNYLLLIEKNKYERKMFRDITIPIPKYFRKN